jgi:hypothetical protein
MNIYVYKYQIICIFLYIIYIFCLLSYLMLCIFVILYIFNMYEYQNNRIFVKHIMLFGYQIKYGVIIRIILPFIVNLLFRLINLTYFYEFLIFKVFC